MRRQLLVSVVFVSALGAAIGAQGRRVEIILDVSGSMKAPMGSGSKMDAAKRAIREAITGLDEGGVVGLRYYGHRVPQERKAESCKDTELVVQFQALDRSSFLRVVDGAVPRGQTPIAYSLEQAARDFGAPSDEERSIVLVSDGEETCGGDPLATVRDLAAQGFKVKVHTIGFDVDAAARAQLESISRATGGEFYDARDTSALAESLRQVTQKALLIQRDSTFGEVIRGGNTYDDAVPIKPGSPTDWITISGRTRATISPWTSRTAREWRSRFRPSKRASRSRASARSSAATRLRAWLSTVPTGSSFAGRT